MLYDGATHAIDGSLAAVLGPFFRTEIVDRAADRVDPHAAAATGTHTHVTREELVELVG